MAVLLDPEAPRAHEVPVFLTPEPLGKATSGRFVGSGLSAAADAESSLPWFWRDAGPGLLAVHRDQQTHSREEHQSIRHDRTKPDGPAVILSRLRIMPRSQVELEHERDQVCSVSACSSGLFRVFGDL
jgi:hypothetical protein